MREVLKFKLLPLLAPVNGYKFDVQLWKSIDGGETFWYTGNGKFCRSVEEADAYINRIFESR